MAIVAVAVIAVVALAIPLGIAVGRLYRDDEVIRLEREAARAAQEVGGSVGGADPVELTGGRGETRLGLYALDGNRTAGAGPFQADAVVRRALRGESADATLAGELVVAVPVAREERVVGAMRAALDEGAVAARVRRAWLVMGALGAAAVGIAGLVALVLSRRLARPIERLAGAAERLGAGDFTVAPEASGVAEIDTAGFALAATAGRLRDVLERERAFSADASHQLRTPLAALRLELEAAALDPARSSVERLSAKGLVQVDRLERTIETLLELARDQAGSTERIGVAELLAEVDGEWRGALAATGRPLRTETERRASALEVSARPAHEILRVLLENAERHGTGSVTVAARAVDAAVVFAVRDEGVLAGDPSRLFERRDASAAGLGIGLTLARSLAEAEGGRLVYDAAAPSTTFTLVLPSLPPASDSSR